MSEHLAGEPGGAERGLPSEPDASPHRVINPEGLAAPVGFSHALVAAPGRLVFLGGQTAHGPDGGLLGETMVEQFGAAAANLATALAAAGGRPEHLVSLHIYVTDAEVYRSALGPIGDAYRRHLGRHYPATALLEVAGLFDPRASVELVGVAVIPS